MNTLLSTAAALSPCMLAGSEPTSAQAALPGSSSSVVASSRPARCWEAL